MGLHAGHLGGGWDSGFCWTLGMEAGIVDFHFGHLGWRLG